jgi:hypothetical protein
MKPAQRALQRLAAFAWCYTAKSDTPIVRPLQPPQQPNREPILPLPHGDRAHRPLYGALVGAWPCPLNHARPG